MSLYSKIERDLDPLKNPETTEAEAQRFVLEKLNQGEFAPTHIESKDSMLGFLKAVDSFGELRHLNFLKTTFSDVAFDALVENISLASRVTSLYLGQFLAKRTARLCAMAPVLTSFTLEGDVELPQLRRFLDQNPQISGLALSKISLRDNQLIHLLDGLRLTSLSLPYNLLENGCVMLLLNLLERNGCYLNLEGNLITALPADFLLKVVHSKLQRVNFSNNRLPDNKLIALFNEPSPISNRDKKLQIDFYPQKVFPTPNYTAISCHLKVLNIETNVPEEVFQQGMQAENCTPIKLAFQELLHAKEFTAPLVEGLNKILGNNNLLASWNEFLEAALKIQFSIQDVPSDGNCLFEAVARHLQMSKEVLRLLVAYQEKCNRDVYSAYCDEGNFDQHLMLIAENQIWGGNVEIAAMHKLVDRPIVVYNPAHPLKLENDKILPPDICIYGKLSAESNPIHLLHTIDRTGSKSYKELHYKALFPKEVDRSAVCVWPERFKKPPAHDTLKMLFTDEAVSVENAIIRLWPLIRDKEIRIENFKITSLNSIAALCEWIVPTVGYITSLYFNNATFSPPCWNFFINALNDTRSIRVLRYPTITEEQKLDLKKKCAFLEFVFHPE